MLFWTSSTVTVHQNHYDSWIDSRSDAGRAIGPNIVGRFCYYVLHAWRQKHGILHKHNGFNKLWQRIKFKITCPFITHTHKLNLTFLPTKNRTVFTCQFAVCPILWHIALYMFVILTSRWDGEADVWWILMRIWLSTFSDTCSIAGEDDS